MAREYAQIKLAIWADDDWRDLSPLARYLYLTLLTSPTLSHCGVADWRPARIGALNGMTPADVEVFGAELIEALYIIVDESSEEVLIRSFVRNDGLMKQPKMAVAMASAHAAVASKEIRGVVVHELKRLREDFPDLNGWGSEKASSLLGLRSIDPSTYPLGKGSGKESGKGIPTPSGKGSGKGSPTPAPIPTPNNLAPASLAVEVDRSATESVKGATRKRPATRLPDDWQPTDTHREREADGIDVDHEAAKFRLHAEANGRRQVNWNAAFSQWLLNARPTPQSAQRAPVSRIPHVSELEQPPSGLSPDEYAQWEWQQRQKRGRA